MYFVLTSRRVPYPSTHFGDLTWPSRSDSGKAGGQFQPKLLFPHDAVVITIFKQGLVDAMRKYTFRGLRATTGLRTQCELPHNRHELILSMQM